ncbi:MAG: DNA-processing protein DprA [Acidimicrobiales bacterium]
MTDAFHASPGPSDPAAPLRRHGMGLDPAAGLPDEAFALALSTLPGMWPARLAALLRLRRAEPGLFGSDEPSDRRSAAQGWALVRSGRAADDQLVARVLGPRADTAAIGTRWAAAAHRTDVVGLWEAHRRAGVRVDVVGSPGYPVRLAGDRMPPPVIFRAGPDADLEGPTVAMVGTRRCTPLGRDIAMEFGRALGDAGVRVVSGLALGIDGAAHEGALQSTVARPVAVIAGGADRPYPARHRRLWREVSSVGVLVSEWPLGAGSEGWHFPARNRVIAAVSDVVLVVESRATGGSMITADEALRRDKPVLAVPGSIRNPAAAGTNRLLSDGAIPACDVADVILALSMVRPDLPVATSRRLCGSQVATSPTGGVSAPVGDAATVLDAVGWEPTAVDDVLRRCPIERSQVILHLAMLELGGWIVGGAGWWQRAARPPT